ncbi:hypothetical protein BJ742DRAFT_376193 [Cladochytrium replicatum]|nr:hypothetical protein BJ742DRAFT_376193 [Cladochytrium replicatum]
MANNDDTSSRAAIAKRRREEASRRGHSDQEDEDSAVDEQDDDNLDAGSIKSIEEDQEDQSEDGHGDSEDEDNDDDEDRDGDDKNEEVAEDLPEWAKSRARPEKRADKNQPIEISSKKPVSRRRQVVEIKRMNYMDPRFEKRAGNFNEDLFKKSYGFLDEYRDSEIQMLKQEIAREKGEWRRESLSKTLQRMLSQQETRAAKERTQKLKSEWRKTEVEQIRAGKKKAPYFLKKSDVKKLELMEKFSAVGGNAAGGPGKKGNALALDKFLEKKRKRKAAKERVLLPRTRRSAQEE